MMNEILGGSPISRLFTEVREKQSLCYYCTATPDSLKGILTVCAGIRDDNRQKAEDAILMQIDAMQQGIFTNEEMSAALHAIESALLGIRDSRATLESFTMRRLLAGADTSPQAYLEALRAVTREQITACANKLSLDTVFYLKPEDPKGGDKDAYEYEEA